MSQDELQGGGSPTNSNPSVSSSDDVGIIGNDQILHHGNEANNKPPAENRQIIVCLLCERKVGLEKIHDHIHDHVNLSIVPYECQKCDFQTHKSGILISHCHRNNHHPLSLAFRRRFKYANIIFETILNDSLTAAKLGDSQPVLVHRTRAIRSRSSDSGSEETPSDQDFVPQKKKPRISEEDGGDDDKTEETGNNEPVPEEDRKQEVEESEPLMIPRRKCLRCGSFVPDRTVDMYKHISDEHEQKMKLSCPICPRRYRGFRCLNEHVEKRHKECGKLSILTVKEKGKLSQKMAQFFPRKSIKRKLYLPKKLSTAGIDGGEKPGESDDGGFTAGTAQPTGTIVDGLPTAASDEPVIRNVKDQVCNGSKTKLARLSKRLKRQVRSDPNAPTECKLCGKFLWSEGGRKSHSATQHLKFLIDCPVEGCNKAEFLPETLNVHIRHYHPDRKGCKVHPSTEWKQELQKQLRLCFPGYYAQPSPSSVTTGTESGEALPSAEKEGEKVPSKMMPVGFERDQDHLIQSAEGNGIALPEESKKALDPERKGSRIVVNDRHKLSKQRSFKPEEDKETLTSDKAMPSNVGIGKMEEVVAEVEGVQIAIPEAGQKEDLSKDGDDEIVFLEEVLRKSPTTSTSSKSLPQKIPGGGALALTPRSSLEGEGSTSAQAIKTGSVSRGSFVAEVGAPHHGADHPDQNLRHQKAVKSIQNTVKEGNGPHQTSAEKGGDCGTARCSLCGMRFQMVDGPAMERHVWEKHMKVNTAPYGCKRCQFHCYVIQDLRVHWVTAHDAPMTKFEFRRRVNPALYEQYNTSCYACFHRVYCYTCSKK